MDTSTATIPVPSGLRLSDLIDVARDREVVHIRRTGAGYVEAYAYLDAACHQRQDGQLDDAGFARARAIAAVLRLNDDHMARLVGMYDERDDERGAVLAERAA